MLIYNLQSFLLFKVSICVSFCRDSTCKFNRKVQDLFFFPEESTKVAVAYQEIGDPNVPYNDAALFGSIWDVSEYSTEYCSFEAQLLAFSLQSKLFFRPDVQTCSEFYTALPTPLNRVQSQRNKLRRWLIVDRPAM